MGGICVCFFCDVWDLSFFFLGGFGIAGSYVEMLTIFVFFGDFGRIPCDGRDRACADGDFRFGADFAWYVGYADDSGFVFFSFGVGFGADWYR